MSATKALNKPLAQLDFKPLSNEIKALPYKANANLKAHLRDINAKTNELLDSMQEFKNTAKEIKLLPYNKSSENKAVEVDRFSNVLDSKPLQELQSLRNNLAAILTPILNKDITNISSGITAQVSKTSIKKMGSDKAVNKSIENGFSLQQHFKASADIENLYKNATKKATTKDLKNGDPAIQMHTFISQVNDNTNAKILVKESLDKDSRRIYTLELESLESTKPLAQVPNGDLADHLTKSKQKSDTSLTPLENVGEIIPQKTEKDISKESKSTQWQQFIHNALPNELKHYAKFSGEQLNKIKEANELDKDIFFSRWHNH
ncbi:MAG: hypothetical protein SPJ83_02515, partial [Helicobacter sp.]|uniref:LPD3 domain-containing protein n=1 Tax=Helicobacter sp. TaxID=218 RepID=UPI002A91DD1E